MKHSMETGRLSSNAPLAALDTKGWHSSLNAYTERLMGLLSGSEIKVFWHTLRHTVGFGRQSARISIPQFCEGVVREGQRVDIGTRLSPEAVRKALEGLLKLRVIAIVEPAVKGRNLPPGYAICPLQMMDWEGLQERHEGSREGKQAQTSNARKKRLDPSSTESEARNNVTYLGVSQTEPETRQSGVSSTEVESSVQQRSVGVSSTEFSGSVEQRSLGTPLETHLEKHIQKKYTAGKTPPHAHDARSDDPENGGSEGRPADRLEQVHLRDIKSTVTDDKVRVIDDGGIPTLSLSPEIDAAVEAERLALELYREPRIANEAFIATGGNYGLHTDQLRDWIIRLGLRLVKGEQISHETVKLARERAVASWAAIEKRKKVPLTGRCSLGWLVTEILKVLDEKTAAERVDVGTEAAPMAPTTRRKGNRDDEQRERAGSTVEQYLAQHGMQKFG